MSDRIVFDEVTACRQIAGGRVSVEVATLGCITVLRVEHAPGWRWTIHSAEEAGTARCMKMHVGIMVGGRLGILPANGQAYEAVLGDMVVIGPGHDAWTIGDEPAVMVDFGENEAPQLFGLSNEA